MLPAGCNTVPINVLAEGGGPGADADENGVAAGAGSDKRVTVTCLCNSRASTKYLAYET